MSEAKMEQCPRCFGRGFTLTYPKLAHGRTAIRARNCQRCGGSGQIEAKPRRASRKHVANP